MPRSKFFKAESVMAMSFEQDAVFSATSEKNSINVVEDDQKIMSIRTFFPETWIWSIEVAE